MLLAIFCAGALLPFLTYFIVVFFLTIGTVSKLSLKVVRFVGLSFVLAITYLSGVWLRFIVSLTSLEEINPQSNSLDWRIWHWQRLLGDWSTHKFFGKGFGVSELLVDSTGYLPHNDYLRLLLDLGIVGFGLISSLTLALILLWKDKSSLLLNRAVISFLLLSAAGGNLMGQSIATILIPYYLRKRCPT